MFAKKICYSEICKIYDLKKNFILLKSHERFRVNGLLKKNFFDEKLRKLLKSLRTQKYQPKCNKKVSVFQAEKRSQRVALVSARIRCIIKFF